MKKSGIIALAFLVIFLAGSRVSTQAAPYSLEVDEFGPGYYRDLAPGVDNSWQVWNGALGPDPTWAGHTSLIYVGLRSVDFSGNRDLLVLDQSGAVSDMLRFWDPPNPLYTLTIFYSSDTSGGSPADTGIPPLGPSDIVVGSVIENLDGTFNWTNPATGNIFKGWSEGRAEVPEPATMLLLGSGLIGLAGYGRKKFFKK